jgi:hypothetical protein
MNPIIEGASHFWGIGRARKTDLSAYPRKCGTHPIIEKRLSFCTTSSKIY